MDVNSGTDSSDHDQENVTCLCVNTSSLARRNSRNGPVRAIYSFPRHNESCFVDISNTGSVWKTESPMFSIGDPSPAALTDTDISNVLPSVYSPTEQSSMCQLRRTCSVDALNHLKRHQKDPKINKHCKCVDETKRHRRLSSLCSNGEENSLPKEKVKGKRALRSSSKCFYSSCYKCQFASSCAKTIRPSSATFNVCSNNGRHSVIGFTIGSPHSTGVQQATVTCSSEGSPVGVGRQRSSIDSAMELECIPTFTYDSNFALIDGRKCPVEFERLSVEDKSSNTLSTLWPHSPRQVPSAGRKASLGGGGCSPNSFARDPPAGCERVQVIHEDRALSDFSNTPIFFAPDKKVGLILKPSSNSAFCSLLPSRISTKSPAMTTVLSHSDSDINSGIET